MMDGEATERQVDGPLPQDRRRVPNPQGIPVVLSDGRTWVLAHGALAPVLLAQADEIFDFLLLRQSIPIGAAHVVAWKLLLANYNLTDEEIQILLVGAKDEAAAKALDEAVANAAADALFGTQPPRRTWSTWALSALYANNIDPATIPPFLVHEVLYQLVNTGRAMGQSDYIDSAESARKRAQLYAQIPGLQRVMTNGATPSTSHE